MSDGPGSEAQRRRRERGARASELRAAHDRRRAAESEQAQALVDRFVEDAVRRGLPTEELTARPWTGRGRYRTGVLGWYLRQDHSIGVDTHGAYYVLTIAPHRLGRWRGITLTPSPPPLQVGEGARDGESIALTELLQRRLDW
jgi:hypothetical protein